MPDTSLAMPSRAPSVVTSVTWNFGAPPSRRPMASSRMASRRPASVSGPATVNFHARYRLVRSTPAAAMRVNMKL
ncbi:MAG: hypothetical protein ACOYOQ_02600 [Microthrixaceae bacterium]